jgi:hypothetical protein
VFLLRFTGLSALALFCAIAWYLSPLEPGVVALQFAFTPKSFAAIVHAWPAEHLLRYRRHLPLDGLLLACYGSFGYLFARRAALFAGSSRAARLVLTWMLPAAAAFDAVENALHWWLTELPRFGVTLPYALSAACSTLKWALLLGYAVAVVHALARDASARDGR